MAANEGVAPLDPTTDVGMLRVMIGDTEYTEVSPGLGNYELFSDQELSVFIARSGSLDEAAADSLMQLSIGAALEAKSVKDFDLQVDLSKRSSELRQVANMWRQRAEVVGGDIFELFPTVSTCGCVPEGAPRTVCRRGCDGLRLF